MSIKLYEGATELTLSQADKEVFEACCKTLKDKIVACGYAQQAVDALSLELSFYTLTIKPGENAYHRHANGLPVYVLRLTTPGEWQDLAHLGKGAVFTDLQPEHQSMILVFELGMNLIPNMGRILKSYYPGFLDEDCAGGSEGPAGVFDVETTFQYVYIKPYMEALTDMMVFRLETLAKEQRPAAPMATPKPPRGPGF